MASSTAQLLLLVILLSVDAILLVDARPPENKIIGGSKIDIKDVPWQVALSTRRGNKYYLCGGSIINDRWILTAAHCTDDADEVTVLAGTSNLKDGRASKYTAVDIVKHPGYNNLTHNDISLLKTDRPITFGKGVAKATLPKAGAPPPNPGSPVRVSGWGRFSNERNETSDHLMSVGTKMVDFATCALLFRKYNPQETIQLCAGLEGFNSCFGDSGSPLVAENIVIGIVSYGGEKCADGPSMYTKVSAYVKWIKEHTRH